MAEHRSGRGIGCGEGGRAWEAMSRAPPQSSESVCAARRAAGRAASCDAGDCPAITRTHAAGTPLARIPRLHGRARIGTHPRFIGGGLGSPLAQARLTSWSARRNIIRRSARALQPCVDLLLYKHVAGTPACTVASLQCACCLRTSLCRRPTVDTDRYHVHVVWRPQPRTSWWAHRVDIVRP